MTLGLVHGTGAPGIVQRADAVYGWLPVGSAAQQLEEAEDGIVGREMSGMGGGVWVDQPMLGDRSLRRR
jgi:hypothetical protein